MDQIDTSASQPLYGVGTNPIIRKMRGSSRNVLINATNIYIQFASSLSNTKLNTSTKLLVRATRCRRGRSLLLILSKGHTTELVYKRATLLYTTRYAAVARWNIQTRISSEEIAWS